MATFGKKTPSQTVLDEAPGRVLAFLRGIGHSPPIHALIAGAGFTSEDNAQGWKLLFAEAGYDAENASQASTKVAPWLSAASEVERWEDGGVRRIRAALAHLHAVQAEFVFGASVQTGDAVLRVGLLLDRLDALETGKGRAKSARSGDREAISTLAKRGFTSEERRRLRALCEAARAIDVPAPHAIARKSAKHRYEASVALYRWYTDWSETARSVVTKRIHLIALGLAKRKSPTKKATSLVVTKALR